MLLYSNLGVSLHNHALNSKPFAQVHLTPFALQSHLHKTTFFALERVCTLKTSVCTFVYTERLLHNYASMQRIFLTATYTTYIYTTESLHSKLAQNKLCRQQTCTGVTQHVFTMFKNVSQQLFCSRQFFADF